MTCRHSPGDTECSSHPSNRYRYESSSSSYASSDTPEASNYEIVQMQRIDTHLVLKVKYPNCSRCEFEGQKVMVFLDIPEDKAMMWRKIDPHFRNKKASAKEAPSPDARFPASNQGWADAVAYAQGKVKPRVR